MRHIRFTGFKTIEIRLLPRGVIGAPRLGRLIRRACPPYALYAGLFCAAPEAVAIAPVAARADVDLGPAAKAVEEAVRERPVPIGRRLAAATPSSRWEPEVNVAGDHEGPELLTPGPRLFLEAHLATTPRPRSRIPAGSCVHRGLHRRPAPLSARSHTSASRATATFESQARLGDFVPFSTAQKCERETPARSGR